jgi:hypothetical protein
VVSFTPRQLYPLGKSSRFPMVRRLGGPQSRSGRFREEKILYPTGILKTDVFIIRRRERTYDFFVVIVILPEYVVLAADKRDTVEENTFSRCVLLNTYVTASLV